MQSIPLIDCPRDGFGKPDLQRPMDDHFPVGSGCNDRQPSLIGQHRVNPPLTGPENSDQVFPGQQIPTPIFLPVGPVANKSSSSKFHPGSPGLFDPQPIDVQQPGAQASPGRKLPTLEDRLFRCFEVMAQITQQQQQIQQQLQQAFSSAAASTPENAMAAAPSSSIHPATEAKQHFEVKAVPRYDPPRCEPAQAQEPRKAISRKKQSVNSSSTTSQQIGSLAAATETEGGSTRDVTSDGHDRRKLVSVPERPRQRLGHDCKNSFGQQFPFKQTTSTISSLVAAGANRQHLRIKVVCRIVDHGSWSITKSTETSANHPSPWPPPRHVFRFNEIGGGRDSRIQFLPVKIKIEQQRIIRLNHQPLKMSISSRSLQIHSVRCPLPS